MIEYIAENPPRNQRATLGQQILDKMSTSGHETQTIRDTTDEMGKEYMRSLWKIITEHQYLRKDYYIAEVIKADAILPNSVKCIHTARWTMPMPEWGMGCYRVSNNDSECYYEWGLPSESEGELIYANPLGWERKTSEDVLRFYDYLKYFNKNKPNVYGNYHSMPLDRKAEIISTIPIDIRREFEEGCVKYWEELLKKSYMGSHGRCSSS